MYRSPPYFFNSTFVRYRAYDPPKEDASDETKKAYEEKRFHSLAYAFNAYLESFGVRPVDDSTFGEWRKKYFKDTVLCPAKSDYCNTCSYYKTTIDSCNISMNLSGQRLDQAVEMRYKRDIANRLERMLRYHKRAAALEQLIYYIDHKKCLTDSEQYCELSRHSWQALLIPEQMQLKKLRDERVVVIAADFKMSELTPNRGTIPQPSIAFYQPKINHHVFGIVNHEYKDIASRQLYITEFRSAGDKDTDHVLSYLRLWCNANLSGDVKHLCIYLDGAAYFKNSYILMFFVECLYQNEHISSIRIKFMAPGHTKFHPDRLFAMLSQNLRSENVFNIDALRQWSLAIARTEIANENHIMNYKECLLLKYNRFNGVKNFNDFYIYREEDGRVLIKAKRYLFTGEQGKIALNSFEQLMDEAANDIYTRAEFAKWKSMMAGMNPEWLDGKFNDEYGAPVDLLKREKKDFWVNNALRSAKELGRMVHFPVEKLKGYYYQYADIPKHQWPNS